MNRQPILSIVTIACNNPTELQRTLRSTTPMVETQHVEQIVIDGSQGDMCQDVIARSGLPCTVLYEPDRGKYDAMNKGIGLAKGRYVMFLNSGDEIWTGIDFHALLGVLTHCDNRRLVYSDVILSLHGRWFLKRGAKPTASGKPTGEWLPSHQSTIYPTAFARSVYYDISYKWSADTEFTLRALDELEPIYYPQAISVFALGGASTRWNSFSEAVSHCNEQIRSRRKGLGSKLFCICKQTVKYFVMRVLGWDRYYWLMFRLRIRSYKAL